ncbi:hypothetical protein BCR34DRAFT_143714 [Clohesyomyces aquaticus]|uniref:Uncharacterized protein n=1 Tax=Clohesyomyces aquaticus TaxID=1231657 RepID=A0A1Y2A0D0_9PLEO|nr:hypothetical protein BCR34DRAFT_143714 [Clohesyomyces aquaticus]
MEDHASSSAHDAKSNRRQLRKRLDATAYSMPGQKDPTFAISDQYGPSIEPELVPLARALFSLDLQLFLRVHAVNRKCTSSTDETRKAEAVRRVGDFMELKRQWRDIDSGQRQFRQSYVQDNSFVPVWVEGLRIVKETLRSINFSGKQDQKQREYMKILASYETLAGKLHDEMIDLARQGLLDKEVLFSIQERWIRLDEILDWYYDLLNGQIGEGVHPMSRAAPQWSEVRSLVRVHEGKITSDDEGTQVEAASRLKKATQSESTAKTFVSKRDGAIILWSTFFGCAVTSTALFALGYAHSPHLQGSTHDADFWFLIQTTTMQLLGLGASALLGWNSGDIPKWRWALPTGIAGACSITAIPIYLVVPTEWSTFLSLVAGGTQSFLLLQQFLF